MSELFLQFGDNPIDFHIFFSFQGLVGCASEVAIDAIIGAGLEGYEIDAQGSTQSP
jgi:hypothetical protein